MSEGGWILTKSPIGEKSLSEKVPEDFAIAEGEGDRTYRYWKEVHVEFFTNELQAVGLEFTEDMLLVCQRFILVDVR